MNPTLGLAIFLAVFLTVKGFLKPSFLPTNYETLSQAQRQKERMAAKKLTRQNMDFGFKLLKKLASNNPGRNILLSPLSISTAFSMLCLGAQDSTLDEIKTGFNFRNMPEKDLHEGFHYIIRELNQNTQDLKVSIGNTMFIDQRLQPQSKFLEDAENFYSAETIRTNFQNLENTQKQINDFISQKTHGKINNLIKTIDPGTVMLLTNYIFFQGKWRHEFDPNLTKEEDFFLEKNNTVKVPMMFHSDMYQVGYDDKLSCTILKIPYRKNITAIFVLPDEGKLKDLEEGLQVDIFSRWKTLLSRRVVDVSVPRLYITGTFDLRKTLSYMGVTKIFEEHGDLTKISPRRSLKVSEAVHRAMLKMDERGTEGAAGTGAQTLPMETPLVVKINKPYLLLIYDEKIPSVLFLGKIVNPTEK
ncbi:serpin A12 [Saimiri boliviensis]|uniref:Serpin family A member 12 n=1 Tax=Saimiri boliviensis boliviensis TaxID=39432 RepID=A0A2K6TEJ9_SAIBB|nr:serpin A12 [Saimiri boliviensis boliviensis]XP_010337763.1 serpin A12 [Saimiri boliviensis boliviensis]XP_010337764.1 serpin A12 [Saimiri boliviensis boliviensis]XP_039325071.1 serpin A12 [Saimiri boliviensis boliviensis]XP_039325072.1 serpin A12 [Saimiri boliviensis boliviensis]XP_039325073.1 serpin A12 [Saimiri boliviensis boliviensis]